MATVASVYSVAPDVRSPEAIMHADGGEELPRPQVKNKRVWASVDRDAHKVMDERFEEALRRDPTRERQWVVLIAGDRQQLAYIQTAATHH